MLDSWRRAAEQGRPHQLHSALRIPRCPRPALQTSLTAKALLCKSVACQGALQPPPELELCLCHLPTCPQKTTGAWDGDLGHSISMYTPTVPRSRRAKPLCQEAGKSKDKQVLWKGVRKQRLYTAGTTPTTLGIIVLPALPQARWPEAPAKCSLIPVSQESRVCMKDA